MAERPQGTGLHTHTQQCSRKADLVPYFVWSENWKQTLDIEMKQPWKDSRHTRADTPRLTRANTLQASSGFEGEAKQHNKAFASSSYALD
jgi:hypothetical protein